MKDKVLFFIIGLLVGSIITASGFLFFQNVSRKTNRMQNGKQMQMMQRPDGETPPQMPNGMQNNDNNMPDGQMKKDFSANSRTN